MRNMEKNTTGVIGLAVVLLTIGGLMMFFKFGDDIIAKLFLIAGTVAAAAGMAGLILNLVMAPGIARYLIAGVAVFALFLGTLWYFYTQTEWGKEIAKVKEEAERVESEKDKIEDERDRLKDELTHLRNTPPEIVTVTVTFHETKESTLAITVAELKTITVKLPAVTVTEVVKTSSGTETAEVAQLRRRIGELESDLRHKDIESAINEIESLNNSNGRGNNANPSETDSPPQVGKTAPESPPNNTEKPGEKGKAKNEGQDELSIMSEADQNKMRQIRENVRKKKEKNPGYKPTKREERASGVADLLEKITDSFELIVTQVTDGDTFVGMKRGDAAATMTVRLSTIDAPEMREPWGEGAKSFLTNILGGKNGIVRVKPIGFDKYGRLIAVVFRRGVVNESIVRQGRAQLIEHYCAEYNQISSCDNLIKAQDEAQKNGRGVWGERPPQPQEALSNFF